MKVLVVFYSMYGHIYKMAQAIAEGVKEVPGAEVVLRQVPETLSDEVLGKMGALEAQKAMANIPVCQVDELAGADAIIFGAPTRFGNMCGQMRQFLDATGQLWAKGALVGKVGSVFTSSATQHGGQESTILTFTSPCSTRGWSSSAFPMRSRARCGSTRSPAAPPTVLRPSPEGKGSACPARTSLPPPAGRANTWRKSPQN